MKNLISVCLLITVLFSSCAKDDGIDPDTTIPDPVDPTPESPVVFDPQSLPYATLSEYKFFTGVLSDLEPAEGVLPYDLITPLFTDYASKKRFVWMPDSLSATYAGDNETFDFPYGTILIKNFYYDNVQPSNVRRIIETRLLYKLEDGWHFAEYVWNEAQTEATFDLSGSQTHISWLNGDGEIIEIDYQIPTEAQCLTCHKTTNLPVPIGPKPQNMNHAYAYQSGITNQLEKWQEMSYLSGNVPTEINTVVAWDDPTALLLDRVRSYIDINCAHCHKEESHCDYRPMRLAFDETEDPVNIGVCVPPHQFIENQLTNIITPGNINRSMMHFRMLSTDEGNRMPLLGRTVVHQEAVNLLVEYINSLEDPC